MTENAKKGGNLRRLVRVYGFGDKEYLDKEEINL